MVTGLMTRIDHRVILSNSDASNLSPAALPFFKSCYML